MKVVDGIVYVSEKRAADRAASTPTATGRRPVPDRRDVAVRRQLPRVRVRPALRRRLLLPRPAQCHQQRRRDDRSRRPWPTAGTSIKINRATGRSRYVAGGLRTPHGIGWGPENGIFVTDNQGGWLPASKLVQIKQDRFFNHYINPPGPFDNKPVTPARAVDAAERDRQLARAPRVLLNGGPTRARCCAVTSPTAACSAASWRRSNGEYQGAVFR